MRVILRRTSEQLTEYEVDGLHAEASDQEVVEAVLSGRNTAGEKVKVQLVERCVPVVSAPTLVMRGEPDLAQAGRRLADARGLLDEVVDAAKRAAAAADRSGLSERRIADELGVTRNTLRAWLGKPRQT